jgi:hypothetical protein
MNPAPNSVFNAIENCGICEDHKPFHFEMGGQRIMLVSFAPSCAAQHRPLYFMLLFRQLCLALFGGAAPSEAFIREFYDPAGDIYWTHYQKCFRREMTGGTPPCAPLLVREIEALEPEIIILLGRETIAHLPPERHPCLAAKKDGAPRQVFRADFPSRENAAQYAEIRRALRPYIGWLQVECEHPAFSGANFMDLEYASVAALDEFTHPENISGFERAWMDGIVLPNLRAYNLVLQSFIFIESNIKNLLESGPAPRGDIETRWLTPFEELLSRRARDHAAVRALMEDIHSLHALRNVIAHKSGVIDDQGGERNLKNIARLRRLKGVYIYGGNSVFVSREGIDSILGVCDRFRGMYTECFMR